MKTQTLNSRIPEVGSLDMNSVNPTGSPLAFILNDMLTNPQPANAQAARRFQSRVRPEPADVN